MQEAPGRTRAATYFGFEVGCIADLFTISGFLPQMSMRRMRTTAEGSSIRVMAMKLMGFEIISLHLIRLVLPDIGVLGEVDLVSTERRERLKRKKKQLPT